MNDIRKSAIVTGASRGIGRAIALRLAEDGFAIVVNYASNHQQAEGLVAEIRQAGGEAEAIRGDVADADDMARLFDASKKAFGRIDVVVNSAGVMHNAPIAPDSLAVFDKTIATNLRGSFNVLAQAGRHVERGGRIVAVSTSVLGMAFPTYGPYVASKAGVEALVKIMAAELRGREITVNAVAPGPVATELFFNGKSEAQVEHLRKLAPLERLGEPEDIARVVSFLAGPDGAWINSQVLRANGGYV
ncbi:SDR family oxidoreductase [Herbaspirillum sp. WKF16]|jgi:3-oxoacyl-[acyl-carrier protein] reductase|uniref:SDR family oxidoreductase n=1 Tax=Herbaspirillum sp. WKF16 TaxID=3028312 RepID=UPI0023A953E1|nr:SDR family oxidoreductase [Herbaspirillum sp. WKF16]WDZ95996.1 SDR family oxidoreductase [Herbaspirillum sp. WKF16]